MSISRITRTVAAGALALGVVGALAPAAVAAPAAPRAAAVCVSTPPAPVNLARNSWTQQLIFQVCDDGSTWTIKAHALMKPQLNLGYKPANVTNCTAHQELQHIGGSTSDKAVNGSRTDVARRPQGRQLDPGRDLDRRRSRQVHPERLGQRGHRRSGRLHRRRVGVDGLARPEVIIT